MDDNKEESSRGRVVSMQSYALKSLDTRRNNITLLRLVAAWLVLFTHSWTLLGAKGAQQYNAVDAFLLGVMPFNMKLSGVAVALFFVLSGFLITKSFVVSKTFSRYVISRIIRIYPALWVCVLVCAFGFGAYFSDIPFSEYAGHKKTVKYVETNMLMFKVDYRLPAMEHLFPDNPNKNGINGSLWTLPAEIRAYILVAVFGLLAAFRSKLTFISAVGLIVAYYVFGQADFALMAHKGHYRLMLFFLIGSAAYVFREYIEVKFIVTFALGVVAVLLRRTELFEIFGSIALAHFFFCLAYHPKIQLPPIDPIGDYSYGLYLYAFPVQQAIIAFQPDISPVMLVLQATLFAGLCAFLSWHLVEKPMIGVKRVFQNQTEKRIGQLESAW